MEATTLLDYIFATFWKDYEEYVMAEEKFRKLSLDYRFLYFYNILKKKKCLPDVKPVTTKSVTKAIEFRKLGDQAFCKKRDVEAVKYYTKSAAAALPGSAELASAYANRSAALYRLEGYTAALIDINRALKGSYPETLKSKLEDRKRNCLIKLRAPDQKISSFLSAVEQLAISLNPARGKPPSVPANFEFDNNLTDVNYEHRFPLPPENYPEPTTLPYTSNKVKVKYSPQFGRHIVATKEIKPGETLGMEDPFASTLALNYKYSHCAHCYVRSESLIPCPTCSLLMFCSEKCLSVAYSRYHRVECKILHNAEHFDIRDDIWLAVRMLMIVTKQGEELMTLMKHPIYKNPMKIDPSYIPTNFDTGDYLNIHNLEDHATKAPFEQNYSLGFTAVLIVHILKYSSFFDEKNEYAKKKVSPDFSSKECYAGTLLLKFLFVIKHNAFKITETLIGDDLVKFDTLEIGSSIYIFHSYFNHSCEENGAKCFHKNVIVSRTVQLVNTGEQIFLNYGMNFGKTPCKDRLNYLREEYKFDCSCQACTFDWPLLEDTNAATLPKLRRNSIKSDSLKVFSARTRELRLQPSLSFDRVKFDLLCNHMEIYHKSVKKPWKEYYECQKKLKEIYSTAANHYCQKMDSFLQCL